MQKRCINIRDNFYLYQELLFKEKELKETRLVLEPKQKNWKETSTDVHHNSDDIIVFCAAKKVFEHKYGLKLFIKQLFEAPVFYFDSDGPTHFNNDGYTRLTETPIRTPHINYYDENGVNKARRNEFIEKNEQDLQTDINLGMSLFCSEININQDREVPKIFLDTQIGLFSDDILDIHEGIDFNDED